MSYTIDNNTLKYSNRSALDFEYSILKTLEIDNILIVLLDIPNKVNYTRNVFAFDALGDFLWQINDFELYYKGNWCPYIDIIINDENEIVLFNWCDTAILINPQTGDKIRKYQTK